MNRRVKNGVLQAAFLRLQQLGITQIKMNMVGLDSICIMVHPGEIGALKQVTGNPSDTPKVGGTTQIYMDMVNASERTAVV